MTRPVQSAILLAPSAARKPIYEVLVSQPRGQWSVRALTEALPDVLDDGGGERPGRRVCAVMRRAPASIERYEGVHG